MKKFFILAFLLFLAISFNVPIAKAQNPGSVLLILFKGAELLSSDKSDSKETKSNPNEMLNTYIKEKLQKDFESDTKIKMVIMDPYPPIPVGKSWFLTYDSEWLKPNNNGIKEKYVCVIPLKFDEKKGKLVFTVIDSMHYHVHKEFLTWPIEKQHEYIKKYWDI